MPTFGAGRLSPFLAGGVVTPSWLHESIDGQTGE
jgi:hypothetical protein